MAEQPTPPNAASAGGTDPVPGSPGRLPLAVVVADHRGSITHWSAGARRLFGLTREEARGRAVADVLPVSGVFDVVGDGEDDGAAYAGLYSGAVDGPSRPLPGHPASGRLTFRRADVRQEALWWTYPLTGPHPLRLLALAADPFAVPVGDPDTTDDPHDLEAVGDPGPPVDAGELMTASFARRAELPEDDEVARRLAGVLPAMSPAESDEIVSRVLELGYPMVEINRWHRLPVIPDWGVPRRERRRARRAGTGTDGGTGDTREPPDLEYAAVRERLEFLNEVSASIGTSLELDRTILEVSRAVVPRFTDVAGTYLREQVVAGEGFPDGPPDTSTLWHRVAVEHDDEPGRWDDVVPVGETMPFPEHTPFFRCMTTGRPVLVPRITEEMGDAIAAQFEKRDIRPLITHRSMLVVPLRARRVVLGFMILLRHGSRPPFDDIDVATGAELAARAGLVIDNARMYTRQENLADTLQDSMLPRARPRTAGCDVATRYLPGTRLGRVGGDWFDTIRLPGSRTALVVGDVMGHGLNSAAMMGQLRTAVQTMAAMDTDPAHLLRGLDDLARRLGEHYLATCQYAVYDPVASTLRIANAGHLPPVLVRARDGRGELLDLPTGAPIGVGGVAFRTVTVPVRPGDRLVMCTDGLVEVRGRDIGIGLTALCESAAHPAASMDDACDTVIRALAASTAPDDRRDDVALLMARLNGIPAGDVAVREVPADARRVGEARRWVADRLHGWSLDSLTDPARQVVGELLANAVRHAGPGPVGLRVVRSDALLIEVSDTDPELPVLEEAGPTDEAGRGLAVVGRLARAWGSSRTGHGKTVWCELSLPRHRPPPRH
ncbi:SpoIIE family protein phosphatase [Streptomyces sp. ST2-7A]|uniref:SpoIIE family protein phosphatase n=1 Tax=Streptomyces sp. ST2-7A TaxID=2907214 RepID=UPI001F302B1E|nr:SpoIIE family protein phosphatase [Streptomyces sp. ST2-7A]MCE7081634.1 SpoIIE family protein phosphatase [Streptomyces sp. ST2-7A]